jgi:hypothetical protein
MSTFLDTERTRQARFKQESAFFSNAAKADGVYLGLARSFCLPAQCAGENLFHEIRAAAIANFTDHRIQWHQGETGQPNNHLCSSQVCCVNFLFPFAANPRALVELLRPLFPTIQRGLPIEGGQYVAFEWIGARNYLGEKVRTVRTRGANATSMDAATMFEHSDGRRQIVLIEWKYTESYSGTMKVIAATGTDRTAIYRPLYERSDFPLYKDLLPSFDTLFCEPFYQFMRQQCLAHEMERARELGADTVSLLHIAPAHNHELRKVTSPSLRHLGENVTDVWTALVREPGRFASISTEALFAPILSNADFPELRAWQEYISGRYAWVNEQEASLAALLADVTDQNRPREVDTGPARGQEVW